MIRVPAPRGAVRTVFSDEEDSLRLPAFQGISCLRNPLPNTEKQGESGQQERWRAFPDFRGSLPAGACAFIEEREDLSAWTDGSGACYSTHTGHAGAAVDAEPVAEFRSSPEPLRGSRGLSAVRAEAVLAETVAFVPPIPGLEIQARWVGFEQRIRVLGENAPEVEDIRRGMRLRVELRLRRNGRREAVVVEADLGRDPLEGLRRIKAGVRAAADRVQRRLEAVEAPAGERTVVLGAAVGGVWVHELVGHPLEADRVQARRSWLSPTETPVFSKHLSVVDDPRRGRAPWRFDDEGSPARATPLLREGRVRGLLHDRQTARNAGCPPTGHGRRSSFRDPVLPRMGCTFVAPGPLKAEEVLDGIEEGVFVRRMEAATTSTVTGEATFRVTDADRIRRGALDLPLRPFLLFVDGRVSLSAVNRVGNDLSFDRCIGSCHRDGQPLSISVGAPTICIGVARVVN